MVPRRYGDSGSIRMLASLSNRNCAGNSLYVPVCRPFTKTATHATTIALQSRIQLRAARRPMAYSKLLKGSGLQDDSVDERSRSPPKRKPLHISVPLVELYS